MSGGVRAQGGGVETRVAELERKLAPEPYLTKEANLSDLASIPTARGNLIPAGTIANSQLANMATSRIKGRISSGTGVPEDLTAANVIAILGFALTGTTPGSLTLATGVTIKWGVNAGGADAVQTFPVAFAAGCYYACAQPASLGLAATSLLSTSVESVSSTGFTYRLRQVTSGGTVAASGAAFYWMAIGI